MPIVFSAVACDRDMVANFASCDGNFMEIAEQVLSKLPPCNNKMTYSHGVYLLHYIAEDNYLYFCITDKLCQRSRAFLFLNEIQRRFISSKETDEDFTTVLAAEMYRYSEDYNTIVIRKGELDELNRIGVGCSESILGEKILYINNPDIISYSTISHVNATPGLVSISNVGTNPEVISVESPILERVSAMSPNSEKISVIVPISNTTSTESRNTERISVERSTINKDSDVNLPSDVASATAEDILIASPLIERNSEINPSYDTELITNPTPEIISTPEITILSQTSEQTSTVTTPPIITHLTSISERLLPYSDQEITSTSSTTDNIPEISPRLYIVIIGMVMLVIAMFVYAFGPISCVVVTSIGVYSLLRYYVGTKDKSE